MKDNVFLPSFYPCKCKVGIFERTALFLSHRDLVRNGKIFNPPAPASISTVLNGIFYYD